MRNVPPTPANYAQRSGRADGPARPPWSPPTAPAATATTATTSGARTRWSRSVAAPRLDLGNEDLVRSHVQAIWLAETELPLGRAMPELIDIGDPELPLLRHVREQINAELPQERARQRAERMLGHFVVELKRTPHGGTTNGSNASCDRRRASSTPPVSGGGPSTSGPRPNANSSTTAPTTTPHRRRPAARQTPPRRGRDPAETAAQRAGRRHLSDFNPYRYLASEGFLPGYSFPRLPLAAYIPGRGGKLADRDGDYLQRSRFIAIREFGPGALIYHEGSRYQVKRVQVPTEEGGDVATGEAPPPPKLRIPPRAASWSRHLRDLRDAAPHRHRRLDATHTVFTERRERISSDEEERRRASSWRRPTASMTTASAADAWRRERPTGTGR